MTNEYEFLKKQRYEYYKDTNKIVDNELDDFVDDVVERLNTQDFNKLELLKVKQIQDERISELKEQLKKSLESNNDLLKQIMELQSQLISERLKGEKK